MKLVREHINHFQRGLDPKQAMGTGIYSEIKFRMNGIIVQNPKEMYLRYIEDIEWKDQIDEETGEVGWPYMEIEIDWNPQKTPQFSRNVELRDKIKKELKRILQKLGLSGTVESTNSNYVYNFYPESLHEAQHFTRGLDPKEAMGTGDEWTRKNIDIIRGMKQIAKKYNKKALKINDAIGIMTITNMDVNSFPGQKVHICLHWVDYDFTPGHYEVYIAYHGTNKFARMKKTVGQSNIRICETLKEALEIVDRAVEFGV